MIRGVRPLEGGYTIIEIIIVLAISAAMMFSALLVFNGRVPRTQFSNAVNEFDSKIRDVANQVVNGFYPSQNDITCTAAGVSAGTSTQGTNEGCIFIGRAIQFGPQIDGCSNSGNKDRCDKLGIYTIFGSRLNLAGRDPVSLVEANPRLINVGGNDELLSLGYGLHMTKAFYSGGEVSGIAYAQTFGSSISAGAAAGAQQVQLIALNGEVGETPGDFTSNATARISNVAAVSPVSGVTVCLKSGTSNQYATVTLGQGGQVLATTKQVLDKPEWDALCA